MPERINRNFPGQHARGSLNKARNLLVLLLEVRWSEHRKRACSYPAMISRALNGNIPRYLNFSFLDCKPAICPDIEDSGDPRHDVIQYHMNVESKDTQVCSMNPRMQRMNQGIAGLTFAQRTPTREKLQQSLPLGGRSLSSIRCVENYFEGYKTRPSAS